MEASSPASWWMQADKVLAVQGKGPPAAQHGGLALQYQAEQAKMEDQLSAWAAWPCRRDDGRLTGPAACSIGPCRTRAQVRQQRGGLQERMSC